MISSIVKPSRNVLALVAVDCGRLASSAGPESAAPRPDDVRILLQVNGTGDIAGQIGPIAAQQTIAALRRANPNLPARADMVVKDVVVSYMRQRAEHDRVGERLIPIYSKYLTKDDVRQLTGFYRSPVGRKMVNEMPTISLESAEVGQRWAESILPGLQAQLLTRLKSEKLID